MTRTFDAPSSYHPSNSLLGRAVRAWVGDRLRGEALFIIALTTLTVVVLMTHYLGWALLKPLLTSHPSWQLVFWGGQVGSILVLAGVGLLGIRPGVQITCTPQQVILQQGDRSCTLPVEALDEVTLMSAERYHRHYRHYAATRRFASALPEELILLRAGKGPIVVGLSDAEEQAALYEHLTELHARSPERVPQPGA